ncbi:hypothetical protein K440DRAFT_625884 [Wilcoxina mikolae CBS 423.85]|nr:hypothetical protein K440DRAFT_625884 [Wilcoxina mikolae CBS 423.85]
MPSRSREVATDTLSSKTQAVATASTSSKKAKQIIWLPTVDFDADVAPRLHKFVVEDAHRIFTKSLPKLY